MRNKFELKNINGEWYVGELELKEGAYMHITQAINADKLIASTAKIEGVLQLDRKPFDDFGKVDLEEWSEKTIKRYYGDEYEKMRFDEKIDVKELFKIGYNSAPAKEFTREQMDAAMRYGFHIDIRNLTRNPDNTVADYDLKELIGQYIDSLNTPPHPTHIEIEMKKQNCQCAFEQEKDICIYPNCLTPKNSNGIITDFKLI